ncbi:LTA synthase family protein [Evansella sp. AB-P1]|uniref:LTA synthase family protein n=1 Tax=Evansella sp. AB-P1 TaxID=3037653 RepID=UPI00241F4448|nr:LTA synthase family protein [Evansella sp. AB-P1]MDG5789387.1 LTA synthase family protein [Evansella sp. AB-P1]
MKAIVLKILHEKPIFIIGLSMLWLKTIIVGFWDFNIVLENPLQLLILLLNPIPFLMLFLGLILLAKPSRQAIYLCVFLIVSSFVLFANSVYYREFTDYITIPLLLVGSNMADLSSSVFTLMQWHDIIYFIDIIIIAGLFVWKKQALMKNSRYRFRQLVPFFSVMMIFSVLTIGFANIERPQLLSRSFDRELIVKNIGIYNFHFYDVYLHMNTRAQRVFANEDEFNEINEYTVKVEKREEADYDLFGIAEGKNVILITAESIQNFVIGNEVNGEEITPFLNELIEDSYYFSEFYHQTAQGKTSDSEFLVNNALFPLPRGAVFFTHPTNKYYALPEIMNEHGYFTATLHANNGTFWNRSVMYEQLGFDRFYTDEDYEITADNSIGWGLKDIDFMEQSIEHMLEMPQPFHLNLITLTNHHPFDLGEEDQFIDQYDSNSRTLNQYFPTVRYTDEAIRVFFDRLKEEGLYEDSIILIFGDHYGISSFHNRAMSQYLEKDITPFVEIELQQVPFIIHIPGEEGKVIPDVSGQIDIRPTLLHLLGIKIEKQTTFGRNIFSKEREELVILRNGSFITEDVIYTSETCYDKSTGEPFDLEDGEESPCQPYIEEVQRQLNYSDRIIYGDLLRFEGT